MNNGLDRWSDAQRRVIIAPPGNLLVSAGAGSGKTSVLVERVVRLVAAEGGVDLTRLLVVTFTEAAAAEMRQRIARRLAELREAARSEGDEPAARRLERQQSLLDAAQISTLHSFCYQLVRRNFLRLGLDPDFSILSEQDALLQRRRTAAALCEERLDRGSAAFGDMLVRFAGSDPDRLWTLVNRLDEFARSQPDPEGWLAEMCRRFQQAGGRTVWDLPWGEPFRTWIVRRLLDAWEGVRTASQLAEPHPELAAYARDALQLAEALSALVGRVSPPGDAPPLHEVASALEAVVKGAGNPRAAAHPARDAVKELRSRALNSLREVLEVVGRGEEALVADVAGLAPAVAELVSFVVDFQRRCREQRLARAELDFNDLEHLALQVLLDPESGEARRLQEQYAHVFVDEYQDTSAVQDALIQTLSRPEGNVFAVGDVKQSIYRFRMAEPALFLDRYARFRRGEGGQAVELSDNYRSRPGVVNAVNFLFQQLFSESFSGIRYDERAMMQPAARYPAPPSGCEAVAGPVEVHLIERTDAGADAPGNDAPPGREDAAPEVPGADEEDGDDTAEELSATEKEALVIGRHILAWTGQLGEPPRWVWDAASGAYRPLRLRDVVVLLRSAQSRVTVFLDVFRRLGIPAYGASATGFYAALEVRWLVSALSAVDNPLRDLDLAVWLRSPLCGLADAALADLRAAFPGGRLIHALQRAARQAGWEPVASGATGEDGGQPGGGGAGHVNGVEGAVPPPLVSPGTAQAARQAVEQLERWRQMARRLPAEPVLQAILHETGFVPYVLAMPGGDVRRANVEALLDRARQYDQRAHDGVHGFVSHIRALLEQRADEGEARAVGESEDVVRILTIHQSKGLEYPVVFVADLGRRWHQDADEKRFALHPSLGFGPEWVDEPGHRRWRTLPSIAVAEANLRETLAEEARLLYVACTRARERLVLVGSARDLARSVVAAEQRVDPHQRELPLNTMMGARSALDWLLAALVRHPDAERLRAWAAAHGLPHPTEGVRPADPHSEASAAAGSGWPPADGRTDRGPGLAADVCFHVQVWNAPGATPLPPLRPAAEGSAAGAGSAGSAEDGSDAPVADAPASGSAVRAVRQWLDERLREWSASGNGEAPVREVTLPAHLPLTGDRAAPGKLSATDLRRMWAAAAGTGRQPATGGPSSPGTPHGGAGRPQRSLYVPAAGLLREPRFARAGETDAVERGRAFHLVMQHLSLNIRPEAAAVRAELAVWQQQQRLPPAVLAAVEPEDVVAFLLSEAGQRVRRAARVWRERPFLLRLAGSSGSQPDGPFTVVQGVIDLLAEEADGRWLIVDYKTDRVDPSEVRAKAEEYRAQVEVYRRAVQSVAEGRVVDAFIWFVHPRVLVPSDPLDLGQLWRDGQARAAPEGGSA
ncbi:MAG: UvrD-helicase domain-containing protein [Alicyclobacillaceae bacterium]|nr:UvrD-helicase domain-containing protein [Alicyclobacillaceae bacterium]